MPHRSAIRWLLLGLVLVCVVAVPLLVDRMGSPPTAPQPAAPGSSVAEPATEPSPAPNSPAAPPRAPGRQPQGATGASAQGATPTGPDRVGSQEPTREAAESRSPGPSPRDSSEGGEATRRPPLPPAEQPRKPAEQGGPQAPASAGSSSAYVPFPNPTRTTAPADSGTAAPPAATGDPEAGSATGSPGSSPVAGGSRPGSTEPPSTTPAIVRMLADATEVGVGASVTIHVRIAEGTDVGSVPFHVRFDPAVLQYQRGEEGTFLQGRGKQTAFFAVPTRDAASVVVGLARLGRGDGIDGGGELCTLHFTAVGPGSAQLTFFDEKVRDSSNRIALATFVPVTVTVH